MIKKTIIVLAAGIFLLVSGLIAQVPDARRTGEEVLYEALLGAKGFLVVVESNGCTQKESFRVDSQKNKSQDGSLHYAFTVRRIRPDDCKGMPEKVIISFDLEKDLGIKGKFTYSLTNKIFPARAEEDSLYSIIEKYFSFGERGSKQKEIAPTVRTESRLASVLKDEPAASA